MKQSITLHIFQDDTQPANAKLNEFDFVGFGYVPFNLCGRIKIGEVTCEVDSLSALVIQQAQLARLRKQLGERAAECTAIERQIQNLLAIENAAEVTS